MEEELNKQDLEERLYAMLHHVDETQANVTIDQDSFQVSENTPRSNLKRYWHANGGNSAYQKINPPADTNKNSVQKTKQVDNNKNVVNSKQSENKNISNAKQSENKNILNSKQKEIKNTAKQEEDKDKSSKPKEEKSQPQIPVDLSIFQMPPNISKKTIEIIEQDSDNQVNILESSDEDEVIEVALPPKPTITIESSDDELQIIKTTNSNSNQPKPQEKVIEREVSASPVPSVVSSVSDEFIRSDCIALKISSRHPDNHSFDFSLHGSDLLQSTPSKRKKKKKNKNAVTSTPIAESAVQAVSDGCFATPKSKAKNKKLKKNISATIKNVPNVDVYDSDSNLSAAEMSKNNSYTVTEKSLPNADVYESDSNQSEIIKEQPSKQINDINSSESSISVDKESETLQNSHIIDITSNKTYDSISFVDLTESDNFTTLDNTDLSESIVMGNVTGFTEPDNCDNESVNKTNQKNSSMYGSTKVPAILNEDLDFDNLKGNDKVCRRRRYSLTTLRAEMEKFYNESWGGEDFNHREIQKSMSRDKSLWAIDPKDRMSPMMKKKITCNYCNRAGHRDEVCRMKPPVCYMCGSTGHFEPRCPRKICVNCGSPNHMYSTMCGNCRQWGALVCAECGQRGHPASHCPDLWRRYHNTIDTNMPIQRNQQTKKHYHLFCSGCTKRGHLVHTCRTTIPFSGLPINSPYVCVYRPIYPINMESDETPNKHKNRNISQDSIVGSVNSQKNDNKRQSKSPTVHETHLNKKRNLGVTEDETPENTVNKNTVQRKVSVSEDVNKKKDTSKTIAIEKVDAPKTNNHIERALDFIPITTSNQDEKGNMIQDNEVSDSSNVVTSARLYVTNDIIDKLKTKEGEQWLKDVIQKHDVNVQYGDVNFLNIRGKVADQEAFQNEFRIWAKSKNEKEANEVSKENQNGLNNLGMLPKNRQHLITTLNKAFASLQNELGDPNALYKELMYLQNEKQKLLTRKDISPKQVTNNRTNIKRLLKTLNMVLIGQAGLANGTRHLNELHVLQEKLMNSKEILTSSEERLEILEHYSNIFGPICRDDYIDLLNKYYTFKVSSSLYKKKNNERYFIPNLKKKANKVIGTPNQPNTGELREGPDGYTKKLCDDNKNAHIKKKLTFYHRRLLQARPNSIELKKTRGELVRRLHSFIASSNGNINARKLKKIKKIQDQAQMFLAHV